MHPFRKFIEQYTRLSPEDWSAIVERIAQKDFGKGEIILKEGETCRHLYFLETGLLRYYVFNDGHEVTKYFTDAPFVFTSQRSFTTETPSQENIECLENSKIWLMTFKDANDLLALKSWSEFVRKIIQEVQYYTEQILLDVQTTTAEERYKTMLNNSPELIQRVPLKHLASYFGIHPQSLSRIRKQLTSSDRS